MKIVIFGLGRGIEYIEKALKQEHQIVGYSDTYARLSSYNGVPFYRYIQLKELLNEIDYLIIGIRNRKVALQVYYKMQCDFCENKEKILPFYPLSETENWKAEIVNNSGKEIDGIVLGTSMAYFDIDTKKMPGHCLKFASRSQDLYGNYGALSSAYEFLKYKIKPKYVVIDMMTHHYINFDVSVVKNFFESIFQGGFRDKHNFDKNKWYSSSFEEILRDQYGVKLPTKDERELLETLFNEFVALENSESEQLRYFSIPEGYEGDSDWRQTSIIIKSYEETIQSNKAYLEETLKLCKKMNPEIEIIFVFLPIYQEYFTKLQPYIEPWERKMADYYKELICKYKCVFWDYSNDDRIFTNRHFFRDNIHLNVIGEECMTYIIKEDLERLLLDREGNTN